MRRDRTFLRSVPFARNDFKSIVHTDYPGAHDTTYRAHLDTLVDDSRAAWPNIPAYDYSEADHQTWSLVSELLLRLQDRYACRAYLEGREELGLTTHHVPQLDDVSATLEAATGFMLAPVGGLLDKSEFLPMLADGVMRGTPYVRPPAYPCFTPEPDILHEWRGHAPTFMNPLLAQLSVVLGRAARSAVEASNTEMLELIGLFYWYTVEYGLILEDGEVKIFGAGNTGGVQDLLRSVDPTIEKQPFRLESIRQLSIDFDAPQTMFFVAESYDQITRLAEELEAMAQADASTREPLSM